MTENKKPSKGWFLKNVISSSTSNMARKLTKKKKDKKVKSNIQQDSSGTKTLSVTAPSSSRTFFKESSRSIRRIFPQKKLTVYMAKDVTKAKEDKVEQYADDEESYGSWQKGPEYRHLMPVYRPKKRCE